MANDEFEEIGSSRESRTINAYKRPFESGKNFRCTLKGFFPFLEWLPNYSIKDQLIGDVVGGIMGAIMNLTKGSAYAQLAGIAPVNGLYALCLSSFVYPVFASWSQGSMCAFAIIQLMCGAAVEEIMSNGNETELLAHGIEPSTIVSTLTFMNGVMFLLFALLHLQFLTAHFSKPLISGFLTAAILYLIMAQAGNVIGVKRPKQRDTKFGGFFNDLYAFVLLLPNINFMTSFLSLICFIFLLSSKSLLDAQFKKRVNSKRFIMPWELLLVIFVTFFVYLFNLDSKFKVKTVGAVPSGLPYLQPPNLRLVPQLLHHSIAISILAFHISLARVMCQRKKYKIDEQQEIYAMSGAHLFTGFFPSFPTTNGLGRAMVIDACGATTQICSIVTAAVLLLVLLAAGPLFYWIPLCVLAVIVLVSSKELLKGFRDFPYYWSRSKWDGFIWISTFMSSLLLDVIFGLAIGIIPKWDAKVKDDLAILKFHSLLTFSNVETFNEAIEHICQKWSDKVEIEKCLILDCSAISAFDTYALETLSKTRKELNSNFNCTLLFVEMETEYQRQLSLLDSTIDPTLFLSSVDDALSSLHSDPKQKDETAEEMSNFI